MRLIAASVLIGLSLAACATDAPGGSQEDASALPEAVRALCEARNEASVEAGRRIFLDQAHEGLHEIARRVTEEDRLLAAHLLEAIQRVEAAFATETAPEAARKLLSQLLREANASLQELSLSRVGCR